MAPHGLQLWNHGSWLCCLLLAKSQPCLGTKCSATSLLYFPFGNCSCLLLHCANFQVLLHPCVQILAVILQTDFT